MTHIEADRLLELSRAGDAESRAGDAERGHLAECAVCRDALAREHEVARAIRSIPWPAPSAGFVAATQARFVTLRRAREVRRRLVAAVSAAVLTLVLIAATATVGVIAIKQIALFAALQLKNLAVAYDIVATLVGSSSFVPVAMAALCAVGLGISTMLIARVARGPVLLAGRA